jgi:hypothetical protein
MIRKSLLNNILTRCRKELVNRDEPYKHWSFLIRYNKIFSVGINRSIEPPKFFGYHAYIDCTKNKPKWHAELDAIYTCNRKIADSIMVNVRLIRTGEIRMSMPCKVCRNLLKISRIKKVFFTTEYG